MVNTPCGRTSVNHFTRRKDFSLKGSRRSGGGESSASVQVNEDGTVIVATGSPDIGGSRASMALMAAETLGVDYSQIRSIVADTSSVGYTHVTGGSRVTFATGMAVVEASKKIVDELRGRAAMIWDVNVEGVVWERRGLTQHSSPIFAGRRRRFGLYGLDGLISRSTFSTQPCDCVWLAPACQGPSRS